MGCPKERSTKVALDTKATLGPGAVKDTSICWSKRSIRWRGPWRRGLNRSSWRRGLRTKVWIGTSVPASKGRQRSSRGQCRGQDGQGRPERASQLPGEVCDAYELRREYTRASPGMGKTVARHLRTCLLKEARTLQDSWIFRGHSAKRQVAKHCAVQLVQPGVHQARYFGRTKTLVQALMAATVVNLTLVAAKMPQSRDGCTEPVPSLLFSRARSNLDLIPHRANSLNARFSPFPNRTANQTPVLWRASAPLRLQQRDWGFSWRGCLWMNEELSS